MFLFFLCSFSMHSFSQNKKNVHPSALQISHVNMWETMWTHRPEWAYGCVSCTLQVQGPWRELQFNPNEWGHYVSAYNIEKLCKWIRCYTTMLLLSKHKQHCTNGQMFTMLKYDEIHPRGGIHDYTYTHKGKIALVYKRLLFANLWIMVRSHECWTSMKLTFWPAPTDFYRTR